VCRAQKKRSLCLCCCSVCMPLPPVRPARLREEVLSCPCSRLVFSAKKMMMLHPAHWHLLEGSVAQGASTSAAAPAPNLPWFVTTEGMIFVAVMLPENQKPTLALPLPPLSSSWQLVESSPQGPSVHVVLVGPLQTSESLLELFRRTGAPPPEQAVGPDSWLCWAVTFRSEADVRKMGCCVEEARVPWRYLCSVPTELRVVSEVVALS